MHSRLKGCISLSLSSLLLISSSFQVLSQTAPQNPPATPQDEVLKISTDLVQTDLVVLDKKGRNVKGLTKDQFELLVDGQPQNISFFESVETGSTSEAAKLAAAGNQGSGAKTSERPSTLTSPMPGRSFIFFVDDYHLSPEGVQRTGELLNNFVSQMGEDDRALVLSPSGQIGFLQQLTDHKAALKLAISRIKYQSQTAPIQTQRRPMTTYEALAIERNQRDVIEYKTREYMDDMGQTRAPQPTRTSTGGQFDPPRPSNTDFLARQMTAEVAIKSEARNIMLHANTVTEAVLGSLEYVARGAGTLPGRKLFFFISDGFIFDERHSKNTDRLYRVIDSAARSGVAIYTVDSRGLTVGNVSASQDPVSDIPIGSISSPSAGPITSASAVARANDSNMKDILRTIAADTGGRAILNRNDLESGVSQILKETESYYVLAWKPLAIEAGRPKFSSLKVTVKGQPELRVLARKGFFTASPPVIPEETKPAAKDSKAAAAKPSEIELRAALTAAFPRRQLGLSAYTTYSNETGDTYKIISFADLANYQIKSGGGSKAGEVDFYVTVLDNSGKSVTSVGQKVNIPESNPQPFRVTATLPNALPPGLYQVRVAARDAQSGKLGSSFQWIEIPKFEPGKLSLSSILLAEITGKAGEVPALDVNRRFARTSSLLIQMFIYNARPAANGSPDVAVTLQVLQDGKQVIAAPSQPISTTGVTDLTRLQYGAEIPLSGFPPGRYALKLTVEDRGGKTTASQQINITIE
ncbi:MAG TPA: VWA domain-containing protein [Pyrinomonadaceae bacterium]|nr:VWA domain-containing protein [Pyrinomonadaceae bacterium]